MFSFWRHRLFRQTWHPSFEELMLHLDGESVPKGGRVGTHTKNCWSCRMRLEKIDHAISEFMESRNATFAGPPALPRQALQNFAARLDRLDDECGSPRLFSGLVREYTEGVFTRRASPRLATILASLCLIVVVFVRLNLPQPVSAKEILFQVRQAEVRQMMQVSAPVIYEKFQLRRSSRSRLETVTWEIWNDTRNNRMRQRVSDTRDEALPVGSASASTRIPPLLEDFGEVFRSHEADLAWPLSPSNYELWRGSVPQESEKVLHGTLPDGDKAAILKVSGHGPFPLGAVVGVEFTVRAADWHPVGQRLLVQRQDEIMDYSLGEIAFDVIALDAVPSSIFGQPAPNGTQITKPAVWRIAPVPVHSDFWAAGAELLPSEADLTAAEVEARYAIHSVRACIGRPIAVRLGVGGIEVEGVVDSDKRKAEVLLALRGIPHVAAAIRSVADEAAVPLAVNPDEPALHSAGRIQDGDQAEQPKLAIEALLRQYFTEGKCAGRQGSVQSNCIQEEIANLSREALAHSEGAHAQAWALRRLVGWEPFLRRDKLRTSTRRLLQLMVQDHMEALRDELQNSHAQLRPILSRLLQRDSSEQESQPIGTQDLQGDWVAGSLLHLCANVEESVDLTLGTFAETNRPVSDPERAMKDLQSKLDFLRAEFPKLEIDVGAELSGFSKTLVSSEKAERK